MLGRSKRQNKANTDSKSTQTVKQDVYGYDTLVLATEWSGSVCKARACNKGRPVNKNFFNLHGLWPNDSVDFQKSPFDCDSSKVVLNNLPLETQNTLNFFWNPLYSTADGFLNHEWSKHGTCWVPAPKDIE